MNNVMSNTSLFQSNEEIKTTEKCDVMNATFKEYDVIAGTPQQIKKKVCIRNKKTTRVGKKGITTKISHFSQDQQYAVNEFCVKRNQLNITYKIRSEFIDVNGKYKQPYVFFDIEDLLLLPEFYQPVNVNIKTVGIYSENKINTHCLTQHNSSSNIKPLSILLDLKLLDVCPADNSAVEIYGFIDFQKKYVNLPIFVVEFWTSVNNNFNKYIQCLGIQKHYVPCCYKNVVKCDNNFTSLEAVDYTFEEMDESFVNKKIDYIEKMCTEVSQIMNIDENIFE